MGEMAHQTTKLCQCCTNHSKCIHTTNISPCSSTIIVFAPSCMNMRDGHLEILPKLCSQLLQYYPKLRGPRGQKGFEGELRWQTKYTLQLKSACMHLHCIPVCFKDSGRVLFDVNLLSCHKAYSRFKQEHLSKV